MYSRILVALDGQSFSSRALHDAVEVALLADAAITAVSVVEHYVSMSDVVAGIQEEKTFRSLARENASLVLSDAQEYFTRFGARGSTVLEDAFGEPVADVIVRLAVRLDAELIAIGTHGRAGIGRLLLGSVAESVLRQTKVPLLLVKSFRDVPAQT